MKVKMTKDLSLGNMWPPIWNQIIEGNRKERKEGKVNLDQDIPNTRRGKV